MFPDAPFKPAPGASLRSFSVQHFLWENATRRLSPTQLAEKLATLAADAGEWHFTDLARTLAQRLAQRFSSTESLSGSKIGLAHSEAAYEDRSDRQIVEQTVCAGQGLGIGASWGVIGEA